MRSNGGTNGHPFQVTLSERRLADVVATELAGAEISIHAEEGSWIVSIEGAKTDQLVVRVLDATRDALAGQPSASALVRLEGREYVMRGDEQEGR